MNNTLHPLKIQQIKNTAIPFPLFLYEGDDIENITQAIYISELSDNNAMILPETITVVKENGIGIKTTAIYQMVNAVKTGSDELNPMDN
jgi:hypothetical protein